MGSFASFGVVRTHAVPAFRGALSELCEILSTASGSRFVGFAAASYPELASELERGKVMLAWLPPVLALQLADRSAIEPLAVPVRSGMTSYSTAIIVRDRVPARIESLRGTRMAWVDPDSSSGYIVPRLYLASLGCDLRDFFSQETFHKSHIAVVDAVATGQVDAGATFQSLDASGRVVSAGWTDPEGVTVRSVKIAATAGPIPNDMIVASKKLPLAERLGVQRWLLHLDPRAKQLFNEIIHGSEFRTPPPTHFERLRSMIVSARARRLLEL